MFNFIRVIFVILIAPFLFCSCCQVKHVENIYSSSDSDNSWSFVVVGDSRGIDDPVNKSILSEIVNDIVSKKPIFVLFTGDLVVGHTNSAGLKQQFLAWQDIVEPLDKADIKIYPLRGNHDISSPRDNGRSWREVFSKQYFSASYPKISQDNLSYTISHGSVFIVVLDDYAYKAHGFNQQWLEKQLSLNDDKANIFVARHQPAFKSISEDVDTCMDKDSQARRDKLWSILVKANCRGYFCAHDHFFDHIIIEDSSGKYPNYISQYTVGTAGGPIHHLRSRCEDNYSIYKPVELEHIENFGYLLAQVDGNDLQMIWFNRDTVGHFNPVPLQ